MRSSENSYRDTAGIFRCELLCVTFVSFFVFVCRVDATNWGDTQKIIEALKQMPLEGVRSRRDADDVRAIVVCFLIRKKREL